MPPTNTDEHRCPDSLTERVIGAILEVSNVLGAGFLEKVYERALLHELGLRDIQATAQAPLTIRYKERCIGQNCADLLIEDVLAVELKCVDRLGNEHVAQCLNYLRASGRNVCLPSNPGQRSQRLLENGVTSVVSS